jgi:hypothetical protein
MSVQGIGSVVMSAQDKGEVHPAKMDVERRQMNFAGNPNRRTMLAPRHRQKISD